MALRTKKPPKLYPAASKIIDGKEMVYSFTRPLTQERAMEEFAKALKQGLPSGSVIIVDTDS